MLGEMHAARMLPSSQAQPRASRLCPALPLPCTAQRVAPGRGLIPVVLGVCGYSDKSWRILHGIEILCLFIFVAGLSFGRLHAPCQQRGRDASVLPLPFGTHRARGCPRSPPSSRCVPSSAGSLYSSSPSSPRQEDTVSISSSQKRERALAARVLRPIPGTHGFPAAPGAPTEMPPGTQARHTEVTRTPSCSQRGRRSGTARLPGNLAWIKAGKKVPCVRRCSEWLPGCQVLQPCS